LDGKLANSTTLDFLLQNHDDSFAKALQSVYPEFDWVIWKFKHVPPSFWNDTKNHRQYFEWLSKELSLHKPEDWYGVKLKDICDKEGAGIMPQYYKNSISTALVAVFPEYNWQTWRFEKMNNGFWKQSSHVRDFLDWLADQLNIQRETDWYSVSWKQLQAFRATNLVKKSGGLVQTLSKYFPHHSWNFHKSTATKTQQILAQQIQKILPDLEILYNYKHPLLAFSSHERQMEFDIYVPALSMAVEYQGTCVVHLNNTI
jgi:hypothetical protein